MIQTTKMLLDQYREYANPMSKIRTMVNRGKLIPLTRGLYETDSNTPGHYLAGVLYGPSYLSFEYALSYRGLIPEAVRTYTCATFGKRRSKQYHTPFGTFVYHDIPRAVYPYGVELRMENGYSIQIASSEKALCDKLYSISPLGTHQRMEQYLFEDLRLDEEGFWQLGREDIKVLSGLYGSSNVKLLAEYFQRSAR
jgi:predicted transcriptional regulator of viral defense system